MGSPEGEVFLKKEKGVKSPFDLLLKLCSISHTSFAVSYPSEAISQPPERHC